MRQRLRVLEPFVPVFTLDTARLMWLNGQTDAALEIVKTFRSNFNLSTIYAEQGRYSEAADSLQSFRAGGYLQGLVEAAARLMRTAPTVAASPQTLPRL